MTAGQPVDINVGRTFTIEADSGAVGRPRARLRWQLPSGRYMRRGETFDRFSVSNDGTLRVRNVLPSDAGRYTVSANGKGNGDKVVTTVRVLRKFLTESNHYPNSITTIFIFRSYSCCSSS